MATFTFSGVVRDFAAQPLRGRTLIIRPDPTSAVDGESVYVEPIPPVITDGMGTFSIELLASPHVSYVVTTVGLNVRRVVIPPTEAGETVSYNSLLAQSQEAPVTFDQYLALMDRIAVLEEGLGIIDLSEYATSEFVSTGLSGKAPIEHDHDGVYQPVGDYLTQADLPEPPVVPTSPGDIGAAPADHHHDGRYVRPEDLPTIPDPPDLSGYATTTALAQGLSDKADLDHDHDLVYAKPQDLPTAPQDIGAQPAGDYLTQADLPAPPDLSGYATADHDHDGTYQPVGDYATRDELPTVPDVSDVIREGDPRLTDDRDPTAHQHPTEDITGLQDVLGGKADGDHHHDGRYVRTVNGTGPDGAGNVVVSGGGDDSAPAPSHQTVLIEADTTLPIDRTVLTLRASAPAVLTVPDAPEGTVITVHVAEGWEHISWAAGVVVTGDSPTTETWVVLVRKEGAWHALVSGSGSGGMTGHGRPDFVGDRGILAPIGTVYTDLDGTDGAVQWTVISYNEDFEIATWVVTAGDYWAEGSLSLAGYDACFYSELHLPGSLSVQIALRPSGMGQGVEVVVPAVTIAPPNLPFYFGEPSVYIGGLLADNLVARPVLNPGIDGELFLSEFTIGAFTEEDPWAQGSIMITITGPGGEWPVSTGGGGGGGIL